MHQTIVGGSVKFVSFEVQTLIGSLSRIGILHDEGIVDLHASYASYLKEAQGVYRWRELAREIVPTNMLKFIEGGTLALDAARIAVDYFVKVDNFISRNGERLRYGINEVRLLAPVPRPVSIRDCSTFLQHNRGMGQNSELLATYSQYPPHYRTSTTDVVGPEAPILWPSFTEQLDYELELAVCIGKPGVNISEEKAEDHIFGYTVFNDVSARDIQFKEMSLMLGPGKGKCFQNSNIMGPCLVTPDEINVRNLRMTAKINGHLWSDGNSGDMHATFSQLIAYLSKDDPLYPGEFIGSGTVGYGCGAELNKWIQPNDVVELEIEGIGILRNKVERRKKGEKL